MTRKIIQIAPVREDATGEYVALFALCDDGTVWVEEPHGWVQLDEIPQPHASTPVQGAENTP